MDEELKKINKEIKSYINESNGISIKIRNKVIKLLGEEFSINLPLENYQSIDVVLNSDGSITMRGDNYKSTEKLSPAEIKERYNLFKEKADAILARKETNLYKKNDYNNITNLLIVIGLGIVFVILLLIAINAFLSGNFFNCIYLVIFISSWFVPAVHFTERLEQAKNYLKRKFKK